ncbi:hypothetical protein D3C73_1175200 [compost metagenome]
MQRCSFGATLILASITKLFRSKVVELRCRFPILLVVCRCSFQICFQITLVDRNDANTIRTIYDLQIHQFVDLVTDFKAVRALSPISLYRKRAYGSSVFQIALHYSNIRLVDLNDDLFPNEFRAFHQSARRISRSFEIDIRSMAILDAAFDCSSYSHTDNSQRLAHIKWWPSRNIMILAYQLRDRFKRRQKANTF